MRLEGCADGAELDRRLLAFQVAFFEHDQPAIVNSDASAFQFCDPSQECDVWLGILAHVVVINIFETVELEGEAGSRSDLGPELAQIYLLPAL